MELRGGESGISVSAWASEEIALGQVATAEKSNEITAIPQLLDRIQLPGTLVTIDALGCQKEIVAGVGDYVIAVKDNQPKLLEAVHKALFDDLEREREELQFDERSCRLTKTPRDFAAAEWPWIKAVGYAVLITRSPDATESDEVRFYVGTRDVGPNGEARRCGADGRSSRCTESSTSSSARTTAAPGNAAWPTT